MFKTENCSVNQQLTLKSIGVATGIGIAAAGFLFNPLVITGGVLMTAFQGFDLYYELSYKKITRIFERCGLTKEFEYPKLISKRVNSLGTKYTFRIPYGLSLADFKEHKRAIEIGLRKKITFELDSNYNLVMQTVEKAYPEKFFIDLKTYNLSDMRFYIGADRAGDAIVLDMNGSETNTLITGSIGSGKSVCLNVLIAQAILKSIRLDLIDLKGGCEFNLFRTYDRLNDFAVNEIDAERILSNAVKIMDERYDKLFKANKKSYKDYNKSFPDNPIKPHMIVIDEYSRLMRNEKAKEYLFDLLSRARAANILVVIATQRPSVDVIPGILKANLKNFIIFRAESRIDSEVVTGEKDNWMAYEDLVGNGEGYLKQKGEYIAFKGAYLTDDELMKQIGHKMNRQPFKVFSTISNSAIKPASPPTVTPKLDAESNPNPWNKPKLTHDDIKKINL